VIAVPLLAACGQSPASAAASGGSPGRVAVVASTDVWGDVVAAVGGSHVRVTSVINDPSTDPHSYEATPRTQLALSRADVVVANGGGYDDFMGRLLAAAHSKATVVTAVDASGRAAAARAAGTDLNEHVWYDVPSVARVADRVVSALSAADPADAAAFSANAASFHDRLDALIGREQAARARTEGAGVVVTEPVPLYLLSALGAVDRTPPAFAAAVEEGDDVSPSVLQQTTSLFTGGTVKALICNEQTSSAQTALVQKEATAAHVPVVQVTETLPKGTSYLDWMQHNLDTISAVLS
jgi:zinc/manganese transport system substrate-binding protein